MWPYTTLKPNRPQKPSTYDKQQAKLRRLANEIRCAIQALPEPFSEADVVRVFEQIRATPQEKGDAFWLLDEKPGLFPEYISGGWHSRLRRCRNHPTHGRAMFALFR